MEKDIIVNKEFKATSHSEETNKSVSKGLFEIVKALKKWPSEFKETRREINEVKRKVSRSGGGWREWTSGEEPMGPTGTATNPLLQK